MRPSAAVVTGLFNSYGIAGARNPLGSNLGFNNDGTLFTQTGALNYKGANGTNGYLVVGGNVRMPVGLQGDVLNAIERKSAFVKTDYNLTDKLTLYSQFMYVDLLVNTNSGGSLTQFPTLTTIPSTNPFIPKDLRPCWPRDPIRRRASPGRRDTSGFLGRTGMRTTRSSSTWLGTKGDIVGRLDDSMSSPPTMSRFTIRSCTMRY